MSAILQETLKKKWFDMIRSGEKTEEYREIKPYWDARLIGKEFDYVQFRNGYGEDAPKIVFKCLWIDQGRGLKKWGAPDTDVYIIKLGERL
jgi:hypothetical protein